MFYRFRPLYENISVLSTLVLIVVQLRVLILIPSKINILLFVLVKHKAKYE